MTRQRSTRGFLLVEAAIAVALVTIVTLTSVDLTAKAMFATNWTTHTALANAYLDREAALMRRLGPNDLATRGFIQGESTTNFGASAANGITASNVPLAFFTNGPDTAFSADQVIRTAAIPISNNTYTYTVTLTMALRSDAMSVKGYTNSRTVERTF